MNKEINFKSFLIVLSALVIIEILIMLLIVPTIKNYYHEKEKEEHCGLAVCNEDRSLCYNYDLDGRNTIVTWRGSCK